MSLKFYPKVRDFEIKKQWEYEKHTPSDTATLFAANVKTKFDNLHRLDVSS